MDRSVLTALIGSLLGFSSLGFLGLVSSNGGDAAPQPPAERDWRLLSPVTYENITIFPVVSSVSQDTSAFLTLDEGLSSGEVLVREQGSDTLARSRDGSTVRPPSGGPSVNQLVLINRGKRPLLLLAGELVSGGKQDRIIGKDRIVPVGAEPLPLDVFCVEHGRWSSGANFNAAKAIVHPSVREQAAVNKDQQRVWGAVVGGTTAAPRAAAPPPAMSMADISRTVETEARTQSYDKIYNSRNVGSSIDSFVDEVSRRFAKETSGLKGEHVVGVVIAYGGEVAWSDIFASNDLFRSYWSKLLRSYAVEALARPSLKEVASSSDAGEFLQKLNGRVREETEPGAYRWREINEGKLSEIELDALQPKLMTLHRLLLHRTS